MDLKDLLHEIVVYGRIASESGRLHTLIEDVLGVAEPAAEPAAQLPAAPEPAAQVWTAPPTVAAAPEPAAAVWQPTPAPTPPPAP